MGTHSEQHDVLVECSALPELGRDQQPTGAVELDVGRIAEKKALPGARTDRQARDPLAHRLPDRAGREQQAAVGMAGQGQATFALKHQRFAMTRRDRHPALGIERQR